MKFTRRLSCAASLVTLLGLLGLLGLLASAAARADGFIIAHPGTDISAADIRDIYLGEKQFAGAVMLVPVDNAVAQPEFLSKIVKLDATKYATAWTKKNFRDGINRPPMRSSDPDTVAYVRQTPGAIGYVSASPPGNVRLIQRY